MFRFRWHHTTPRSEVISHGDRVLVIVAIIGVITAVILAPGPYTLGNTLIGLALLATLYACDREDNTWLDCASVGGASALCFILISGVLLINPFARYGDQIGDFATFVLALIIGFPIGYVRYRQLNRKSVALDQESGEY